MSKPTYQELEQLVRSLQEQVRSLQELNRFLQEKVASLEAQLNKNSRNSSKPPSSDQKGNVPQSERNKTKRRPYHPGASRQCLPQDMVTSREKRRIEICPRCRSQMEPTGKSLKWQQVETPKIKPLVHEIELMTCQCTRCHLVQTPKLAPHEMPLMGPNLEAFVNLLMIQFRQSHRLVRGFIEMFIPGFRLSQGAICKAKRRAAEGFSQVAERIIEKLLASEDAKYADATGWRHRAQNWNVITIRDSVLKRYCLREKRNGEVMAKILHRPVDLLVVDRGLSIQKVQVKRVQYCLAHFLRNIQGIAEDPRVSIEETQTLGEIHDALQCLFHLQHRYARSEISLSTWRQYSYREWSWMQETFEQLQDTTECEALRRFCKRCLADWKHFRTYLAQDGPMTNNLAEEGLRNLVIARKLCFGSRSVYGLKWREALHSCAETLKRQGRSVMAFFAETIRAHRMGDPCPAIV